LQTHHSSIEFLVGLTVVIALLLLILGVVYVGDVLTYRDRVNLYVEFPFVSGLEVGDPIWVLGVPKGTVDSIGISRSKVSVRMLIDKDVILYSDAKAQVFDIGVIGQRAIGIEPGASQELWDWNKPLVGVPKIGIGEVVGIFADVVDHVENVVAKLDQHILQISTLDSVRNAINSLVRAAEGIEQMIASGKNTFDNVSQMSKDVGAAVSKIGLRTDELSNELKVSFTNLKQTTSNLQTWSEQLGSISNRLDRIISQVESGQGDLGKLVTQDTIYLQLSQVVSKIDSLITDIKKNPENYLHLSIF